MPDGSVTCEIRHRLDSTRISEFEAYAQIWIKLIERYGGEHHGYFMPREKPAGAKECFEGLASEGPADVAIAIFTFPDEAAYLRYRHQAARDPDGVAANARFGEDPPFISYERLFLRPITEAG